MFFSNGLVALIVAVQAFHWMLYDSFLNLNELLQLVVQYFWDFLVKGDLIVN